MSTPGRAPTGNAPCPACGKPIGRGKVLICAACWWQVPSYDRQKLHSMFLKREDCTSKVQQIVRDLKTRWADKPAAGCAEPGAAAGHD